MVCPCMFWVYVHVCTCAAGLCTQYMHVWLRVCVHGYVCLARGMCTWYMYAWLGVCVHGICMFGLGYVYMVYTCLAGGMCTWYMHAWLGVCVYARHVLRVVEME